MKTGKIPITGFENGNCCPKCGSTKVILWKQFPLITRFDMKGKEIIKDLKGKRMYKPSNEILATLYKAAQQDYQCAFYDCQKCEWKSEIYVP